MLNKREHFHLPDKFFVWAYENRGEMVRTMASGKKISPEKVFLNFTRHTPTFISNGPAGLNGSVKGIGFIPRADKLEAILSDYLNHINNGWRDDYGRKGLQILVKHIWGKNCAQNIDFAVIGSLELASQHTWQNFQANKAVTLLFYQPPTTSFEVRGRVEIHTQGVYHKLINAQHDVYHKPNPLKWDKRPAYIIRIEEIYDNSVGEGGFGTKIL